MNYALIADNRKDKERRKTIAHYWEEENQLHAFCDALVAWLEKSLKRNPGNKSMSALYTRVSDDIIAGEEKSCYLYGQTFFYFAEEREDVKDTLTIAYDAYIASGGCLSFDEWRVTL